MGPIIDQRLVSIHNDAQQIKSINDFTDSLVRELNTADGNPDQALMRELLAEGLRRSLDMGGPEPKRRFLEALAVNIHKFPMQEQQSLSRVYPVEISSDYRNLQSFVLDAVPEEERSAASLGNATIAPPSMEAAALAEAAPPQPPPLTMTPVLAELCRQLTQLPPRPGEAAEELLPNVLHDDVAREVREADARARSAFFGDVRLNLFKFAESGQRSMVEKFPELRVEVARLVVSMTREISRWLDEERAAAAQQGDSEALLTKLRALFQAVLSTPFAATFKHLGGSEKKQKEAFLLKTALCIKTCQERRFTDAQDLGDQVSQLRRQFFYVEGYGELMEDWLQNRIRQFNEEEFDQRVTAVLGTSMPSVLARLQRTFRLGRWLQLIDMQLEEDVYALFLDETFPRHVLTSASIARMLLKISSQGSADFHVYDSIARLAPSRQPAPTGPPPHDAVEASLLQVLQRLPAFPALRRLRSGFYRFGRMEVEFVQRGHDLVSRVAKAGGPVQEAPARDFFARYGPEEFPAAAEMAVQASTGQLGSEAPSTTMIEVSDQSPMGFTTGPTPAPALIQVPSSMGGDAAPMGTLGYPSQRSLFFSSSTPSIGMPMTLPASLTSPMQGFGSLAMSTATSGISGLASPLAPSSLGFGLTSLPRGPPACRGALGGLQRPSLGDGGRFEPYPSGSGSAPALLGSSGLAGLGHAPSLGMNKFGLDDDEI